MDRCIDRMGPGCFFLGYIHAFDVLLRPLFGAIIGLILTTLILTYSLNKKFRIFMDSLSLKSLTLFHAWRIFAGWVFLSFSDRLPQTFINHAAYGDIISGFLALSVFLLMQKKWSYYLFNLVGLVDFFMAAGTGLYLTFLGEPLMQHITWLPLIMIPLWGVPISGFIHVVSLARLGRMKHVRMHETVIE